MIHIVSALISGLLFGAGLTVATMTDPARVLAFLDIAGHWDPTLAFVMGGALLVYLPVYQLVISKNQTTLLNTLCHLPSKQQPDKRLIAGAVLFGLGWGLTGICPGPALANITGATQTVFVFIVPMLAGMMLMRKIV